MRILVPLAAAALGACAVSSNADSPAAGGPDGEVLLSDALAGRTAGEPRSCVSLQELRNTRSAGGNTILFDGPGDIVYVNSASGSCPAIRAWHAIRHRTTGTQMCSGELIRVFDPQTGVEYGGCSLGAFVPWRRTG